MRARVVGGENAVGQAKDGNRCRARHVDTARLVLRECGIWARAHPSCGHGCLASRSSAIMRFLDFPFIEK